MQGNICLDILKEKWSAAYSVRTILLSIQVSRRTNGSGYTGCIRSSCRQRVGDLSAALQSLLGEPNNESPLNVHAAQLWDNQEAFRQMVRAHLPVASSRPEK